MLAGTGQGARQQAPQVKDVCPAGHLPAGQHGAVGGGDHPLQHHLLGWAAQHSE